MLRWIPRIPMSSTRRCGKLAQGPWEDGNEFNGAGGGLFKSTDGGSTWHPLTNGLPKDLSQIYVAIAPSDPRRLYATLAAASGNWASIAPMMPARTGRRSRPTLVLRAASVAAILPVPRVDPKNPDMVYVRSTVTMRSTDGGKTWIGFSRRAGRRRLPEYLDQSQQRQHYSAGQRSGRARHRERRPDLEFLVQPAHGAALSRDRRQCVSLSRLRRTTGKRLGVHFQPRQRRRHHFSRMASRGRDRIRLRGARSARPGHGLRRRPRRGLEIPLVHGPGAERHADSSCAIRNIAPTAPSR